MQWLDAVDNHTRPEAIVLAQTFCILPMTGLLPYQAILLSLTHQESRHCSCSITVACSLTKCAGALSSKWQPADIERDRPACTVCTYGPCF